MGNLSYKVSSLHHSIFVKITLIHTNGDYLGVTRHTLNIQRTHDDWPISCLAWRSFSIRSSLAYCAMSICGCQLKLGCTVYDQCKHGTRKQTCFFFCNNNDIISSCVGTTTVSATTSFG